MSDSPVAPYRVAVYYAPPLDSAHWGFGCRWLGRDPVHNEALQAPPLAGLEPAQQHAVVSQARRYGLHATLKPPFRLHRQATMSDLDVALQSLASGMQSFDLTVELANLHRFLAWRPATETGVQRTADVAATCVRELDHLREPADEAELARRRASGLSARQDALLKQWGYPYVMEEFRFHLTLSDALPDALLGSLRAMLDEADRPFIAQPLRFDALALFIEPTPGADFIYVSRYGFDGQVTRLPGWPS